MLTIISFQGSGGSAFYFCFLILPYIIFGALGWRFYEKMLILITSYLGSYRFVRGISLLAGGFPNELDIYTKFKNVDKFEPHFPKWFYAYLIAILIIFVISAYF